MTRHSRVFLEISDLVYHQASEPTHRATPWGRRAPIRRSLGPVQTGWVTPDLERALLPTIPIGRIGAPEDVADVVVFLASHQARWVTGQKIFVGGAKCDPAPASRPAAHTGGSRYPTFHPGTPSPSTASWPEPSRKFNSTLSLQHLRRIKRLWQLSCMEVLRGSALETVDPAWR